jgi:myo-inositol-1(or 4)-monophosphatase
LRIAGARRQIEAMSHDHDLQAELALALEAAARAAEAVLPYFGTDTPVEYKSPDQPVTAADFAANRVLQEVLIGQRPGYGWLSEETADSEERLGRQRVWIVDPIDGTRSFVEGFAEYAISVALAVDGEAAVGVVLNPSSGETYHAVRGGGAFCNGEPIRISSPPDAMPAMLASRSEIRRGEFDPLRERWRIHPLGSTAYKMVKVADGTGAAYLSRGPKSEWDVCAAALIVTEAGGTVTDVRGSSLQFNRPDPFLSGVVVASPTAHRELLRYVSALPRVERGWSGEMT